MKTLKKFENFKDLLDKHISNFEESKRKTKPVSATIHGKEIIYNPFDREILNDENIGKYVVLNNYSFSLDKVKLKDRETLINFIKNNVGKIIKASLGGDTLYDIKYNNVPKKFSHYFTQRSYDSNPVYLISSEFDFISDNYDDCITYITANKYNL